LSDPSNSSFDMILNRVPLGEQLILDLEENPFAEYMWMENEEEFDRQVEEELWEQDFIESCFNQMLEEEEQWEWFIPSRDLPQHSKPLYLLVLLLTISLMTSNQA
uniref:Polyadenylate-binding protein-interacting protein 2 n=1 Tax=Neogobius melanostomus TaxID=47308 RepID=A0A8C6SKA3_9GOBI